MIAAKPSGVTPVAMPKPDPGPRPAAQTGDEPADQVQQLTPGDLSSAQLERHGVRRTLESVQQRLREDGFHRSCTPFDIRQRF
jgi:hypothetical protein